MNGRLLYTVAEAAEALHIGITKLYELIGTGEIESVRIGRSRRLPRRCVEEYVDRLLDRADDY